MGRPRSASLHAARVRNDDEGRRLAGSRSLAQLRTPSMRTSSLQTLGFKIGFNKRPPRRICQRKRTQADWKINSIGLEGEIRNQQGEIKLTGQVSAPRLVDLITAPLLSAQDGRRALKRTRPEEQYETGTHLINPPLVTGSALINSRRLSPKICPPARVAAQSATSASSVGRTSTARPIGQLLDGVSAGSHNDSIVTAIDYGIAPKSEAIRPARA